MIGGGGAMGTVKKRWYWKVVGGVRVRVQTKCYYASYTLGGKTVRVKGTPDRRATQILLGRLEEEAARRKAGLPDPHAAGEPLDTLLAAYLAVLAARDRSPAHRAAVERHVAAALVGAKWQTLADVTDDSLALYFGRLRRDKRDKRDKSGATLNGHYRSVRAFVRWAARRERKPNPLAEWTPFNEQVTRRRSTEVLSDDQFAALLAAAEGHDHRRGMPGADRRMLYEVAAYTGFRASELAALTPGRFRLDGPCPAIRLPADAAKGRREAAQPLPDFLVPRLAAWLAGKPAGRPVWPGAWARQKFASKWLVADLERAGVPTLDADGRRLNFHSLRRRFVTAVVESGATAKEAQELARHSTAALTLEVYAQTTAGKKAAVVNRLKPPGGG